MVSKIGSISVYFVMLSNEACPN